MALSLVSTEGPDHRDPVLACGDCSLPWSRDATKRGVKTWHIAIPAVVGALSIPLALFMGSPTATIAVITVTACSIFAALPNFWTVPSRFLTGAAAAAGIALINTVGNIAGFAAGYITGALKDLSGGYMIPMFCVGAFMLLSAILMVAVSMKAKPAGDQDTIFCPRSLIEWREDALALARILTWQPSLLSARRLGSSLIPGAARDPSEQRQARSRRRQRVPNTQKR